MTDDAYEVCRYVRHYFEKNGYAPNREVLHAHTPALFLEQLIENGIIRELPLYEGGPPVLVVLTEKGHQMATAKRRRR
jgi:sulfur relay (sulfurtransferase) DsrC/TusE family protein